MKPIKLRWIDINKGDKVNPEYRSRIVAKDFKIDKRWDVFAATPPLEALKMLISLWMTEGIGFTSNNSRMKMEFIDVRRAFFHAPAQREIYIELPEGDEEEGMVGLLDKSLYGTRDAASNWEHAYSEFMEQSGFISGLASPCLFLSLIHI